MLDFTSALYLGFRHASRSLRSWTQMTTGVPAALAEPVGAKAVADRLAALQGCERAVVAPSTLHLFWDLFGMLARDGIAIYVDAGVYPIARWGVELAARRGVPVQGFPHQNVGRLRRLLRRCPGHLRPLVVTDGVCLQCGKLAPLAAYLASIKHADGWLIVDDTQALGILGHSPGPESPYGRGGGGSLRRSNLSSENVILVSSLAKGFGVPIAALSGSAEFVRHFETQSETRVYCSPPSIAELLAAERALQLNAARGDGLRLQLAHRVRRFRRQLATAGFAAVGGLFPVQTLRLNPDLGAGNVYRQLRRLGVQSVLRQGEDGRGACISFIITVRHSFDEIRQAVRALAAVVGARSRVGVV